MALEHPADGGAPHPSPPPEKAVEQLTHLYRAERAAREQAQKGEAHYRSLVECCEDAVFSKTLDGILTTWNPAAERLYGWSAQEVIGKPISLLIPPERGPEVTAIMGRLRRGERVEHFETVRRRKDGSRVDVSVSVSPIRDAGGHVTGAAVIARDITERKRIEAERRAGEERFRALAESVPVFIWSAPPDGVPDYHNPQFLAYLGKRPEDMHGWSCAETLHPDDRERVLAAWAAAFQRGKEYTAELRLRRASDGTYRWFECRAFPLRDAEGRVVRWFGYVHDIHDRKLAEEAVREADRGRDVFVATLAHELRNPLGAIGSALEVIGTRGPERRAAVRQAWEIIDRQAGQLARLVDDLLDASRITQGKLRLDRQRVPLATVVTRAVEAVRPLIDARRHKLAVALPDRPVLLDADPVRLTQVLGNLLANSARYTPEGGHIWLTADRQDDEVVIRVRDNGIGIAPEMLPQVFGLFVQTKRAQENSPAGLGIGLSLVKSLVEAHGGQVGASSPGLGQGSEFWVRLPVAPAGQGGAAEGTGRRPAEPVHTLAPCRVLVVDDSRDAADSLALLLGLWGHATAVAYDGPAALEVARQQRPQVIFLDLGLPGMSGYQVANRLRQEPGLERAVLVALTGYGQEEDRRRAEEAGFRHYLVKPADPDSLRQLLAGLGAPHGPG